MKCPYFVEGPTTETASQCLGVVIPFEPSSVDELQYCTTGRHRYCPLFKSAGRELSLAIHHEIARAIG